MEKLECGLAYTKGPVHQMQSTANLFKPGGKVKVIQSQFENLLLSSRRDLG